MSGIGPTLKSKRIEVIRNRSRSRILGFKFGYLITGSRIFIFQFGFGLTEYLILTETSAELLKLPNLCRISKNQPNPCRIFNKTDKNLTNIWKREKFCTQKTLKIPNFLAKIRIFLRFLGKGLLFEIWKHELWLFIIIF